MAQACIHYRHHRHGGLHLADYLLKETEWEIVGLCRWRSPMDNLSHLVERINAKERVSLLYGDLRDTLSIREEVAKARPDYVFISPPRAFRARASTRRSTPWTRTSGHRPSTGCAEEHAPSRSSMSAPHRSVRPGAQEKLPIDEECTFHPASPYAISQGRH